ncbi:MAG TPA: hypothetical protein PLX35_00105 [Cyclobacteriaceae bacterium]|nr:hypothetical protein [Cyclobacteriaceae bacterium]
MTPRLVSFIFFLTLFRSSLAQNQSFTEVVPADLLATRSVLLYSPSFTSEELNQTQQAFQQIGIDAVAYFEQDVVTAGKDVVKAYTEYFISRQIRNIIFLDKEIDSYALRAALFNQKTSLVDAGTVWRVEQPKLTELLRNVFQDTWRSQKKKNFLVGDSPETDIVVNPILGNRKELYAYDLKVDQLAVPRFGNEEMDKQLAQFFQDNYPLKYKLTDPGTDEKELRRSGCAYILCFVRTRGVAARQVLGYDMNQRETAYASITFPGGQLQLKTLPAQTEVYKFYFRHIDNGNVFLGNKWDADEEWLDALRNHVLGFKTDAKMY